MPAPDSQSIANSSNSLAGKQVLVVDDSPVNRQIIVDLLRFQGMRVDIAEHGQDALDRVNEVLPDAVIMSCQMQVMDAYQAARHLRQRYTPDELTLIAISSERDFDAELRCQASGIDDLLAKPLDAYELIALLRYRLLGDAGAAADEPLLAGEATLSAAIDQDLIKAGLDVRLGLGVTAGNRSAYFDLLRRFVTHHAGDGARLSAIHSSESEQDLIRLAHSLKGVSGNIGAHEVQALAERIERDLRKGEDTQLPSLGRQLNECFCRIAGVLEALSEEADPVKLADGSLDLKDLVQALEDLTSLTRMQDVDAGAKAEDIYRQLTQAARESFKPVLDALKVFQFDLARNHLKSATLSAGIAIRDL